MTSILSSAKNEMTAREFKALLAQLMEEVTDEGQITVHVISGTTEKEIIVHPKSKKRRTPRGPLTLSHIPFEQLEKTTEPGAYISMDALNISDENSVPFYYGLFINHDKVRDLRFFNDEEGALRWLEKKLKAVAR